MTRSTMSIVVKRSIGANNRRAVSMFAFTGAPTPSTGSYNPAFVGETVQLPCGDSETVITPVDWLYQPSADAKGQLIISAGYLTNGDLGGRLNINGSTLIINNVKKDDSGVYSCDEDAGAAGRRHRLVLTVKG